MSWARFYTQAARNLFDGVRFRAVFSEERQEYTVPQHWNQAAVDVLLSKVFHPYALPALTKKVEEAGVPAWLWRSEVDGKGLDGVSAEWRYRMETDVRDVLHRIAGSLTYRAWKNQIFKSEEDAKVFYDELRYVFLYQIASPELAQWQKLGLDWAYGMQDDAAFIPRHRVVPFDAEKPNALRRIKLLGETLAIEGGKTGVTLPVENIDSLAFMRWKRNSDIRHVTQDLGQRVLERMMHHVMDACDRDSFFGFDPARNLELAQAMDDARRSGLPEAAIRMAISYAEQGFEEVPLNQPEEEHTAEEAVKTTVSIPDGFVETALTGHGFMLFDGAEEKKHYPAQKLWDALAEAVWTSGEPGISFRNSIEAANTTGRALSVDASGGFIFLPGSEAPSATINVLACDNDALLHVTRLMVVALDAAARDSEYRPLMLGITNLAPMLMSKGLAYDSDSGRVMAALVTALVSGVALQTSAEIAVAQGAFPAYEAQAKTYLQHIKDKMAALAGTAFLQKGMTRRPVQIRTTLCADTQLVEMVKQAWETAYRLGKETGFRHAHLTGIDTDPVVQAILNAQTQDIMPESALVRFEGYFSETPDGASSLYGKKLNPMVPRALTHLGYTVAEREDMHFYAVGHGTLLDAPHINHKVLREKGFGQAALDAVEAALATALHIRYAFNKWTLGEDFCTHVLGFTTDEMETFTFDMLTALGFSEDDIDAANVYCCGTMTLEGAPHLRPPHLKVFDCIAPCASFGVRRVSPEAQIKMQAAIETFLSGAAAHTVIVGHHSTIDDIQKLILTGWELGVKNLRIYRDGCSLLYPVIQSAQTETTPEEEETCQKLSVNA